MANLKALVCDDEAPLRDLMARRLEKLGLEVERAENGQDAVARLEQKRYDLLVTDIYMPDVTGLELLQKMKALDPHAQVVVVTASATLDNAVGALNHGAFAYLTKPFDHLTVFDNVVARAVEFRRALLANQRMGEVQRRRGDLLEEELTGRIRQVKRTQEFLIRLLACLPVGVVVLDAAGRVDLINPRAEAILEKVLAGGPQALRAVIERIPVVDGERRGETEVDGRRLDLQRIELTIGDEGTREVIVLREPDGGAAAAGTLTHQILLNLRRGLGWLTRRETDGDAQSILRGLSIELTSLANLLDIDLPAEAPPGLAASDPVAATPAESAPEAADLAPAVIPGGNGRKDRPVPERPPEGNPLPAPTNSLMLRKGMTMVLEGRLRKRRGAGEAAARPEDADRLQQKIDRWARSAPEGEPEAPAPDRRPPGNAWPPPLPSADK